MATILTTTYDSTSDTTALTCTLASLATSSGLLVGRESTAVTNVSNLYVDALVSGQITTGTSPTAGTIEVWAYALIKHATSTPTYPSPVTGTDAAITFVAETKPRVSVASISTNATSNTAYAFQPVSVASLFGGVLPIKWGLVVIHNTAVNLNATAGNHWLHYQGIKFTST
jgi:tripartite-type tricarboxylate transporter receptor subunit TctC